MKSTLASAKTSRTGSWCGWLRTRASAAVNWWRCGGAMSTSPAGRSSSAGRFPATPSSARRRAAEHGRSRSRIKPRPRSDRLSRHGESIGLDDYVFANRLGRRLDPSALRHRFERARDAAGLEPLRFHDLRHTYGSLLVAGGIDLASVKAAMGHSRITTTERHLYARPAGELADRFTRALGGAAASMDIARAA